MYLDKWKTLFPKTVGGEQRPADGVGNGLPLNTDGFPQFIANDPVRFDLQNAFLNQLFSNDERLNEFIANAVEKLNTHNQDSNAHKTGIAGNANTATRLRTARTIALSGKAAAAPVAFDGSGNITLNVSELDVPPLPKNISYFTNDAKYITQAAIPTDVSAFRNDAGYAKASQVPKLISDLQDSKGQLGIIAGSLTENGWVRFANGFIIQWGVFNIPTNIANAGTFDVPFPISFPHAPFTAFTQSTQIKENDSFNNGNKVIALTQENMTVQKYERNAKMYWVAIGY